MHDVRTSHTMATGECSTSPVTDAADEGSSARLPHEGAAVRDAVWLFEVAPGWAPRERSGEGSSQPKLQEVGMP